MKPQVIVVCDMPDDAEVLEFVLRDSFEVHVAADSEKALKKAAAINSPLGSSLWIGSMDWKYAKHFVGTRWQARLLLL